MSSTEFRTYSPLSRVDFGAIRADLVKAGVTLQDGDNGTAEAPHGFVVTWSFIEPRPDLGSPWLRVGLTGPGIFMGAGWGAIEGHILPVVPGMKRVS